MQATLLVELLTEELPPKSLARLSQAFCDALAADLGKDGFRAASSAARAYATPRRLAVSISSILDRSPDVAREVQGPSVNAAPAAVAGFAKKNGVAVEALEQRETPKGRVYFANARTAGRLLDEVLLTAVHAGMVDGLLGVRQPMADALGIVESRSAASALHAGDAGLKGADVTLAELRLSDGLAGKGICFFTGTVSAVEIAVEIASAGVSPGHFVHAVVIPQLSPEIAAILHTDSLFFQNLRQ